MTVEELREYVKSYRAENFAGGMIPFDHARNEALKNPLCSPMSAEAAGVYAVLDAFVNHVEIKETNGEQAVLVKLSTGERA